MIANADIELDTELLVLILDNELREKKVLKTSSLFKLFENKAKTGLEEYSFKRKFSSLINCGKVVGFEMKFGRHGGVGRIESRERVTIRCSNGEFTGNIPKSTLTSFLELLKTS